LGHTVKLKKIVLPTNLFNVYWIGSDFFIASLIKNSFPKAMENKSKHTSELIFYDGLCSDTEEKLRLSQRLVSRWEKKGLVAEFCRAGKKNIRTPSGLYKSVLHLLQVRLCMSLN
jgi:hypothetical protein